MAMAKFGYLKRGDYEGFRQKIYLGSLRIADSFLDPDIIILMRMPKISILRSRRVIYGSIVSSRLGHHQGRCSGPTLSFSACSLDLSDRNIIFNSSRSCSHIFGSCTSVLEHLLKSNCVLLCVLELERGSFTDPAVDLRMATAHFDALTSLASWYRIWMSWHSANVTKVINTIWIRGSFSFP